MWRTNPELRERLEKRLLSRRRITIYDCWEWTGSLHKNGYASTTVGKRNHKQYVHRISYELWVGPIPPKLDIDHLCRNRACFNPKHLEPVTRIENIRRGSGPRMMSERFKKIYCHNGHLLTSETTYIHADGYRRCYACYKMKHPGIKHSAKTHCAKGHEYNKENTIWRLNKKTGNFNRYCRECARLSSKRNHQNKKHKEWIEKVDKMLYDLDHKESNL